MSDVEPYDGKAEFFRQFEKMRPDLAHPEWTSEQKKEAAQFLSPNSFKVGMMKVIPVNCLGMDCMYATMAPAIHDDGPTGLPCPVETAYVMQMFNAYAEELQIDVERFVEVSIVRNIVDQEIQLIRKSIRLGQEDFIQENVVGVDQDGNIVTKKELNQTVDYEDRILRRLKDARSQLLATRQDKVKAGQAAADGAQAVASLLEKIRIEDVKRRKQLKLQMGDEIVDAEFVDYGDEDE